MFPIFYLFSICEETFSFPSPGCSLGSTETDGITSRSLKLGLAPFNLDQTAAHDVTRCVPLPDVAPVQAPPANVDRERDTVEVFAMRFVDEREDKDMTSSCPPKQLDALIAPLQPPVKPKESIPAEENNLNLNSSRNGCDADEKPDPNPYEKNNDPTAANPNRNSHHVKTGYGGGFKWSSLVDPPRIELSQMAGGKGKPPNTFSGLTLQQKKLKMLRLAKTLEVKGLTEVNHGSSEPGVKLKPYKREVNEVRGRRSTDPECTRTVCKTRNAKKSGKKLSEWKNRHDVSLGEVKLDQLHFAITPKMPAIIPPVIDK